MLTSIVRCSRAHKSTSVFIEHCIIRLWVSPFLVHRNILFHKPFRLATMSYFETLNDIGDSIVAWADPEGQFSGYTKVRKITRFLMETTLNSTSCLKRYLIFFFANLSSGMVFDRLCLRLQYCSCLLLVCCHWIASDEVYACH